MSRNAEALSAVLDNVRTELLKKVKERKLKRNQPKKEASTPEQEEGVDEEE